MKRRLDSPFATLQVLALVMGLLLGSCGRLAPTSPARESAGPLSVRQTSGTLNNEYTNEVVVQLATDVDGTSFAAEYGAEFVEEEDGLILLRPASGESCESLVLRMSLDPRVRTSERNSTIETAEGRQESVASDDAFGTIGAFQEQPAASSIRLAEAHAVSRGGGVLIAILDTGIDPRHPLLRGRLAPGWDFIDRDSDPTDVRTGRNTDRDGYQDEAFGHGTHVAGIAALTAPGARIMPVRVLDSDGRGDVVSVAAGIRWAVDHGARVLNLSLGMLHSSDAIQSLLDDAESRGVVVVCSAGNWGREDPKEYPAASSHAVAVGATHSDAVTAAFSSYGDHLAVSAPGVGVRSAYPGGGWAIWSGTSMSAPFVAGTAALLLSLHPAWNTEDVMDRIGQSARSIVPTTPERSGLFGAGMLDAGAALLPDREWVQGPDAPVIADDEVVAPVRR